MREPWKEGYRTFSMQVPGTRKPTLDEIRGGMGAGITLWDGSDGIVPVRVAPWHEDGKHVGWDVSVIAKIDGTGNADSEATSVVDLGIFDLSYLYRQPLDDGVVMQRPPGAKEGPDA